MNSDAPRTDNQMDMAAHIRTYENFLTFVKYTIATVAVILIGMAIFLT